MEFLLLWADDLDDAVGAIRHLAPKFIGFLFALALFAGTCFALILTPHVTLALLAVSISAALVEVARRRRRAALSNQG
jgi:hypothetical protein